jgi:CheY-like chemotaxis protein
LHLPALGGDTFAALYRLLPVRHAPIVLVTGDARADEQAQVMSEIQATAVLYKPFEVDGLLACLHRAIHALPDDTVP